MAVAQDACPVTPSRNAPSVLLDQAALIACMAYNDLNPIRAQLTDRPERATHTSGYRRIRARNRHRAAQKIKDRDPVKAARMRKKVGLQTNVEHSEAGLWLTPLMDCIVGEPLANKRITVEEYLMILDATGRLLKDGKRGKKITADLAPILQRLDLSVDAWLAIMRGWRMFAFTSALGHVAARAQELTKRKIKWIKQRCPLFVSDPPRQTG